MKTLLCKAGIRKKKYYIKFFDCLLKFWTLLYGSKTQWSNSQKAKVSSETPTSVPFI